VALQIEKSIFNLQSKKMNSRNFVLAVVFLLGLNFVSCSTSKKAIENEASDSSTEAEISLENISKIQTLSDTEAIIGTLASDEYGGRQPGTEGYLKASQYVEEFFESNKLSPLKKSSFRDSFLFGDQETFNVVGLIEGQTDDYVMICAHLDHLGPAEGEDKVYNGANDNASGVTAALQVAKALAGFDFDQNIIVALFSAEESGLLGSKHLAQRLRKENINLTHVFNFEMVGKTLTTGENEVYITGYKKSNLAEEMNKAVEFEFVKFLPAEIRYQLFSRSDNFPFYAEYQIPSHTISTFDFKNYDHYHKASDEVSLLDIENMNKVINTSTLAIARILQNNMVKLSEKE